MTNRTMAHGGGTPRIVPTDKPHNPIKTAAHGDRVPVSVDKRDEYAAKQRDRWGPYPFRPWPFNPAEPNHSAKRNRFKAFQRYLASEAFSEHVQWVFAYVVMFAWVWYAYEFGG